MRAQVKTLQYELESFKQERELAALRHDKELRDVQLKAEEVFMKAQVRAYVLYCGIELRIETVGKAINDLFGIWMLMLGHDSKRKAANTFRPRNTTP